MMIIIVCGKRRKVLLVFFAFYDISFFHPIGLPMENTPSLSPPHDFLPKYRKSTESRRGREHWNMFYELYGLNGCVKL